MDITWQKKPGPKTTWCQTVMAELIEIKLTRDEALHVIQNKDKWKGTVIALCPTCGQSGLKAGLH